MEVREGGGGGTLIKFPKYIKMRINNIKVNYWASIQRDKASNGVVLKCFHFLIFNEFLKRQYVIRSNVEEFDYM